MWAKHILRSSVRPIAAWMLLLLTCQSSPGQSAPRPASQWTTNDVIALVGGEDLVAWQFHPYFELQLQRRLGGQAPRFRNLAWEGDTVFEQQRDLNFPKWPEQLRRVGATIVLCQFGQNEALRAPESRRTFERQYHVLLDILRADGRQLVLLTPTPFEPAGQGLADLSARNHSVEALADVVQGIARQRQTLFVDLFHPLATAARSGARLTRDGFHLNPRGHWLAAAEISRQLGLGDPGPVPILDDIHGTFRDAELESLRRPLAEKNRLWFDYWRPQNWAFLNGDRVEQPSSRDHRDRTIRWFPREMEQFLPLIARKEVEIAELARRTAQREVTR